MRYFKEVAFWKIILLNFILGLLASGPAFLAIFLLSSGLFAPNTPKDKAFGIGIFILIFVSIVLSNFLLWKFGRNRNSPTTEKTKKGSSLTKFITIVIILALTAGSFFVLPDLWLWLNGWWF